jgi:hypothetical protein
VAHLPKARTVKRRKLEARMQQYKNKCSLLIAMHATMNLLLNATTIAMV